MTEHEKRIREALEAGPVQYACHVDGPDDIDAPCVLDSNRPQDCVYARRLHEKGLCKTDCAEWKPINAPKSTVEVSAANLRALLADLDAMRGALSAAKDGGWQGMESAPLDGTEVMCWREDCGQFIASYTSMDAMPLTQAEIDATDEDTLFAKDWFTQWPQCIRLEGSELPTKWQTLPNPPKGEV